MASVTQPSYVPALRMKAGELAGLRNLMPQVADRVLPRVVIPPPGERDQALEAQLFKVEDEPDVADALAAHWRGRGALVEATHLLPEFGRDAVGRWLPRMLERAPASAPRIGGLAGADCGSPVVTEIGDRERAAGGAAANHRRDEHFPRRR
ncbi:MAG: beta family protein [Thermohalobaculum sp.]